MSETTTTNAPTTVTDDTANTNNNISNRKSNNRKSSNSNSNSNSGGNGVNDVKDVKDVKDGNNHDDDDNCCNNYNNYKNSTGLGVTVAVRLVPVLRPAQGTGSQAYFASKVFLVSVLGGGSGGAGGGRERGRLTSVVFVFSWRSSKVYSQDWFFSVLWSRSSKPPPLRVWCCRSPTSGGSWTNFTHFLRAREVLTENPGHSFYELLFWQTLAHVFMRHSTPAFGRIPCIFNVKVDSDLDIISTSSSYGGAAGADRFFTAEIQCCSDSDQLDVEFRLSEEFLGALDGQQLLVVEGSGCTIGLR